MKPKIGAHVSGAGGLWKALDRAVAIGAETIQLHAFSPRQWNGKPPTNNEIEAFRKKRKETGIGPVFLHAQYLVNLASPSRVIRKKSVAAMVAQLHVARAIGAEGVVFHTGSGGKEHSGDEALANLIASMKEIVHRSKRGPALIVENSSGGGGKVGSTLEELGAVVRGVKSPRVTICLDTAHAFGAGIVDFSPKGLSDFIRDFDRLIGMKRLALIHANDTKAEFGSLKDRHENIGEGHIGREGFKAFAGMRAFWGVPWILETPGFAQVGPDRKNIGRLHKLFSYYDSIANFYDKTR